jgi:PHD/YefM family antitoxin component YafN of YafNO toxin-antitoxin module
METAMSIYTNNELMSSTEIVRNFSSVLDSIKEHRRDKVAILRKNKIEAVILPIEEYEKIQEDSELLEHLRIFQIVKERGETSISEYIDFENLLAENGLGADDL